MWETWHQFCTALGLSDILRNIFDPVPFLQLFSYRYRDGQISCSGAAVRSCNVEEALRSLGRISILLGTKKPHLNSFGNVDDCISCQLD